MGGREGWCWRQIWNGRLLKNLSHRCHQIPVSPSPWTVFWKLSLKSYFLYVFGRFIPSFLIFCHLCWKEKIITTLQLAFPWFYQLFRFSKFQNTLLRYYFHCSPFLVFLLPFLTFFSKMLSCPVQFHTFYFELSVECYEFSSLYNPGSRQQILI